MNTLFRKKQPQFSDSHFDALVASVKDYQLTHGSILKIVRQEEFHTVQARLIGVSLVPNQFPRSLFERAVQLASIYNELYAKAACDETWLESNLGDFLRNDVFAAILWDIHLKSKRGRSGSTQRISLGIFRSDFMVHATGGQEPLSLKQVEFNTFSCAGATHANIAADMHRHMHSAGMYGDTFGDPARPPDRLPPNRGIKGLVDGLAAAHSAYMSTTGCSATAGVLFVVQPNNVNIADERPLEYALWARDPPVPAYRLVFDEQALQQVSLGPAGELLFNSDLPSHASREISVVYLRAGYDLEEYDESRKQARLLFEQSRAVKVPSVLSHITTMKKVQQLLSVPECLEHFLEPDKCAAIYSSFMPMYPLDESEQGKLGRNLAMDTESAGNYVLKPSLEGGGHNVYGKAIPAFLEGAPEEDWSNYILMEKIRSPTQQGLLMSFQGLYEGPVLSELGVVGTCVWRSCDGCEILENEQVGWTFKSKPESVEEMSVVKGYGCFDSPWLVDL